MNIQPRYREGMLLTIGLTYDVEVTKNGFESWNRSIYLNKANPFGEFVIDVVLKRSQDFAEQESVVDTEVVSLQPIERPPGEQVVQPRIEITQEDMAFVYERFEEVQQAILSRRADVLSELVSPSDGLDRINGVISKFVVVDAELTRLSNNAARGEISAILSIKKLVSDQGSTVVPGPALRDFEVRSIRNVNGDWSAVAM